MLQTLWPGVWGCRLLCLLSLALILSVGCRKRAGVTAPTVEDSRTSAPSSSVEAPSLEVALEIGQGGEKGWLIWEARNADFVDVDQGVGRVLPKGRLELPGTGLSQTYTLTAEGPGGSVSRQIRGGELLDSGFNPDEMPALISRPPGDDLRQAPQPVLFGHYSFELDPAAQAVLNRSLNWLSLPENASAHLVIASVSDPAGTEEYGLCLASTRAQVVAAFLRERGIPEARIETVPLGEEEFSSLALPGSEGEEAPVRLILSDSDTLN